MKNYRIEMKWAAVFTVVVVMWFLVEKMLGLHDDKIGQQPIYSLLFGIPAIAVYTLALLDKKANAYQGRMGWKEGMVSGIFLTVFVAVFNPVAQWIGFTVISPQFFENGVRYYVAHKRMTEPEALAYFNLVSFIKKGVFDALSMGVLTSAAVAYFVQTKNLKP